MATEPRKITYEEILKNIEESKKRDLPIQDTVQITPDVAKSILANLNTSNRDIRPLGVTRYASQITEGNWVISTQITFNKEGNLENGQHRLMAIAQSGQTLKTMIAFGVDHNPSLDRPITRSVADNGRMYDHQEYNKAYLGAIQNIHRTSGNTAMNLTDIELIKGYNSVRPTIETLLGKIPGKGNGINVNAAHATALLVIALSENATPDELSATVYTLREGRFGDDIESILKPLRDDIMRKAGAFDPRKSTPAKKMSDSAGEYIKYYIQFIREKKKKPSEAAVTEMFRAARQRINVG